jgi:hypothetical protein
VKRAALALALAGCFAPVAPDVGPIAHAPCSNLDSDPAHDVSFQNDLVDGVLTEYHCAHCHTPTGITPVGFEVTGFDIESYATVMAGARGNPVVVPGAPCGSVIVQKVGEAPPFGGRMPLDGPPFLDDGDIQLLSDWIAEGARDN